MGTEKSLNHPVIKYPWEKRNGSVVDLVEVLKSIWLIDRGRSDVAVIKQLSTNYTTKGKTKIQENSNT